MITIIVLLILAGVSIVTLTGQNGILSQATTAKDKTNRVAAKEKVAVEILGSYGLDGKIDVGILNDNLAHISEITGTPISSLPATVTVDDYTLRISEDGKVAVVTIVDGVIIPEGFYHVLGTTKENGLVISDAEGDDLNNTKQGNQFVWVPVENYDKFVRREGYWSGSLDSFLPDCGEADGNSETGENTYSGVSETETTKAEVKAMYKSVKENEGFYIARFEAGKDDNEKVVSKKGANFYNVQWSSEGSMQETDKKTRGAVELSRAFVSDKGYMSMHSTLCYGVQWDAVMSWIDEKYKTSACDSDSFVVNSTNKGWYINNSGDTAHTTGENIDDVKSNCVKNIYDLAGNVEEWTMESCYTNSRVLRGGSYDYIASDYPASARHNYYPVYSFTYFGFRPTLYL